MELPPPPADGDLDATQPWTARQIGALTSEARRRAVAEGQRAAWQHARWWIWAAFAAGLTIGGLAAIH